MKVKDLIVFSGLLFLVACGGDNSKNSEKQPIPKVDDSQLAYHNPVIKTSVPDPTAIRTADGFYYLYATEDIRNLPIFRSKEWSSGRKSV